MSSDPTWKTLALVAFAVAVGVVGFVAIGRLSGHERARANEAYNRETLKAVQHLRRTAFPEETRPVFLWDAKRGLAASANLPPGLAAALNDTNRVWRSDDPARRRSGVADVGGARLAWRYDKDGKVIGFAADPLEDTPYGEDLWIYSTFGAMTLFAMLMALAFGALLEKDWRRTQAEDRRRAAFLNAVAHDLKMPIGAVGLWTALLRDGKAEAEKAVAVILRENGRMSRMVQNLLEFGRLELGRRQYDFGPVDLGAVARETADAIGYAFEAHGLSVEAARDCVARADADAVRRIVANLAGNAAKYAADDGPVEMTADRAGNRVRLTVSDRGPGLAEADLERCFEKHWRGTGDVVRATGGCGLGLPVARGLARAMGGDVRACAREGGGTAFVLELPAMEEAES